MRNALWVFCTRLNVVVPPLSRVEAPELRGCLTRSGCITNRLYNKTKILLKLYSTNPSVRIRVIFQLTGLNY